MKKVFAVLLGAVLIAAAAFADEPSALALAPVFSIESGVYEGPVVLELSGEGSIFYTTNGDEPTTASTPYTGPITLEGITGFPRTVQGTVPQEETPFAVTVRAAVADSSGNMGEIGTETYFIGENITDFYSLPMVNLTADTYDLWDHTDGIYENYNYEHNVPAYFQYFSSDGQIGPEREVEIKVSGHGSRSPAKKSIRIYFTKGDTSNGKYLEYNIIPDTRANYESDAPVTKFGKVTMRVSDWTGTNLRDVLAQKIGAYTRCDVANSVPVALFLNGEYWGVYECREQYDERYVQYHYGIDNDNIVFLDRDWTLNPQYTVLPDTGTVYTDKIEYSSGPNNGNSKGRLGESYYREQWLYVRSLAEEGNITDPKVYAEFCANVDIDNYIDFVITYLYTANDDWPGNNFKLWRVTDENIDPKTYGADGKWRFMIHDFDIAFEDVNHETLFLSALEQGDDSDARHPAFATALLGSLLKNEEFRNEFAQRTMAYLSTAMSSENITSIVDELAESRSVGKVHDLLRWDLFRGPMGGPREYQEQPEQQFPEQQFSEQQFPPQQKSVDDMREEKMNMWLRSIDRFRFFADERISSLQSQYIRVLNDSYGAGISGTANFRFLSHGGEFSVNGAEISLERYGDRANDFTTIQFAGIPVRISAVNENGETAVLTVTHNGISETFCGEAVFTPENADYVVTADFSSPVPPSSDGQIIGIMRPERFKLMKLGEKLPAVLYDENGGRIYPSVSVSGAVADSDGSVIEAVSPGRGTIRMVYEDKIFETEVIVTR